MEEFLNGQEASYFVIADGNHYLPIGTAQDHKRIGEKDTGQNTGGMGAISPVPFADRFYIEKVEREIIKPTIEGLQKENIIYQKEQGIIKKAGDLKNVIKTNIKFFTLNS